MSWVHLDSVSGEESDEPVTAVIQGLAFDSIDDIPIPAGRNQRGRESFFDSRTVAGILDDYAATSAIGSRRTDHPVPWRTQSASDQRFASPLIVPGAQNHQLIMTHWELHINGRRIAAKAGTLILRLIRLFFSKPTLAAAVCRWTMALNLLVTLIWCRSCWVYNEYEWVRDAFYSSSPRASYYSATQIETLAGDFFLEYYWKRDEELEEEDADLAPVFYVLSNLDRPDVHRTEPRQVIGCDARAYFMFGHDPGTPRVELGLYKFNFQYGVDRWSWPSNPAWHVSIMVPGWFLSLLLALPTARWGYRQWKKHPLLSKGRCKSCGYNLTGNTSGICPECGKPVPAASMLASKPKPVPHG